MEIKITFTQEDFRNQPEIISLLEKLAHVPEKGTDMPAPTMPAPVVPLAQPVEPTAPAVPTAAPQYTLEMIAKAGTALVDAGKMDDLCNLLAKYNVDALTSLNPAQYGAFATELRALGAQI